MAAAAPPSSRLQLRGSGSGSGDVDMFGASRLGSSSSSSSSSSSGFGISDTITPIRELTMRDRNRSWTIKARLVAKSERRSWRKDSGAGEFFDGQFEDATGGRIRVVVFMQAVQKFYDLLQEDKACMRCAVNRSLLSSSCDCRCTRCPMAY